MLGIFILFSYQKIINKKSKGIVYLFGLAVIFAVYMFFVYSHIREPIRAISGILILGCWIWAWKRTINWAALVLALLMGYFAWLVSVGVSAGLLDVLLEMHPNALYWCFALFAQGTVYFGLYKAIPLKNGLPFIRKIEIKGIIFAAAGIVFSFWGGYHMTRNHLHEYNLPLFRAAFTALVIVVSAAVFFIVIFSKRYCERVEVERHCLALEKDNSELSDKHHKIREIAKNTSRLHLVLVNEVKTVTGRDSIEKLPVVQRFLDIAKQVGIELSEELALDDFMKEIRGFMLPEEWLPLKQVVVKTIKTCEQKEFSVFTKNTATTWEQIKIPKIKLVRLVDNLLSNAMKELDKTDTENKALEIYFFDNDDGIFTIEISDTAHEFPDQVLANLGKRSNSTNGTGNGYAEVFEFLAETGASLIIIEQMKTGNPKKTIRVAFDYMERVVIRTDYRYATLKEALIDTRLEIEQWVS